MNGTYNVNGIGFDGYMEAVRFAQAHNAQVIQNDNGLVRWEPIVPKSRKVVQHVFVHADGTEEDLGKYARRMRKADR